MDALKLIEKDSTKAELPKFNIGDTVKVSVNIREGQRERIQMFEGTVIAIKGSGISTVSARLQRLRKISSNLILLIKYHRFYFCGIFY